MPLPVKKYIQLFVTVGALLCAANLFAVESAPSGEASDAKEFIQSKAVQLFVIHKYEEALAEFRLLAAQHPD